MPCMVCMEVVDVSNLMVWNYFDLFLHYQSAVILVSIIIIIIMVFIK